MPGLFLAGTAALLLVAVGFHAVAKQRAAGNIALLAAAVLLGGSAVLSQLSLQLPVSAACREGSLVMEALLPAAFLLLSLTYGRSTPFRTASRTRLISSAALALFPVALLIAGRDDLYYSPDFPREQALFLGNGGYWYYLGIMAAFIVALTNVETTFAATSGRARNQLKFGAFGIMSLLAVLTFYYSQALLYRTITMSLLPVRSGVMIIAALLIGYAHAFRGMELRVSISRHILYRSFTLLAVGVYLISLGLVGEGMRYFGEDFGRNLAVVIAFAGGILLLAVLFSEKLRSRTKVYIRKHFYANKHDYREEWIKLTGRLSSCASMADAREPILTAYTDTFGVAGASLYLLSRDRTKYVRTAGQGMPPTPDALGITDGLRDYFVKRERVLNVSDGEYRLSASEDALFREARASMVVPLVSGGVLEGFTVLREQVVPQKLIHDDYDLMKVMARQAAQTIANFRLSEEVMEMRAVTAGSRISAFVIHDLKNLASSLALVVDNAEEHINNPDFQQDAIRTVRKTVAKMNGLMQRLKSIPEKIALQVSVEDIDSLSRETVAEFLKMKPGVRIVYDGTPCLTRVDREEMRKVLVNLVQNALEAGRDPASVAVKTGRENGGVWVSVADTGSGMTEDFMKNHLFKPFRTTKRNGLGIGLYQTRQIVEAHGGRIEVASQEGKGSVFTVYLPAAPSGEARP